ncbi:MAG TPA: hypothetical protein VG963_14230, partial [Polyangiaceae bacterium]|nr:hypothetical protein [Polyangiaceae bacterium]
MVNAEELRVRGLRAYEIGRLLTASRVGLLLLPVAAVCLLESRGRGTCACLTLALLGIAIWLRWRDRRGVENVATGLMAGSIPLVAALLVDHFDLRCGLAGADTFCTAGSVVLGIGSGLLIAVRKSRWPARLWSFATAAAIAALAASIGCV